MRHFSKTACNLFFKPNIEKPPNNPPDIKDIQISRYHPSILNDIMRNVLKLFQLPNGQMR